MPTTHRLNIEKVAGRCGGRAVIAGSRIRVCVIARWIDMGMTIDEVHEAYPHIQRSDIDDALAYAAEHPEEIARDLADDDAVAAELMAKGSLGQSA